ncbi:hypothetical protein ACHAWF_017675 [Thalassiosira exigua]
MDVDESGTVKLVSRSHPDASGSVFGGGGEERRGGPGGGGGVAPAGIPAVATRDCRAATDGGPSPQRPTDVREGRTFRGDPTARDRRPSPGAFSEGGGAGLRSRPAGTIPQTPRHSRGGGGAVFVRRTGGSNFGASSGGFPSVVARSAALAREAFERARAGFRKDLVVGRGQPPAKCAEKCWRFYSCPFYGDDRAETREDPIIKADQSLSVGWGGGGGLGGLLLAVWRLTGCLLLQFQLLTALNFSRFTTSVSTD